MKIRIPADIFYRASLVAVPYGDDFRPSLQSVRVDAIRGLCVMACNSYIMAVELVDETISGGGAYNIVNHPDLLAWLRFPGVQTLTVEAWPEYGAVVGDIDGVVVPSDILILAPDDEPKQKDWRNLFPSVLPTVDKGFYYMETPLLTALGNSSPSGCLCFPEVLDTSRPVIVRDLHDPNWAGLFVSTHKPGEAKPAIVPHWIF